MKKAILILAVMALMLASIVSASNLISGSNLDVTKVVVKAADGDRTVIQGGNAKKNIKPGDHVEIEMTIENIADTNNASLTEYDINDIDVNVIVDSMEDGEDDLDVDVDKSFDLRLNRDKDVSVDFDVPLYIDDGQYDVTISGSGTTDTGVTESISFTFTIEVEKDSDELMYKNVALVPEKLKCGAESILQVTIVNIGEDDQEDVSLQVSSSELDWSETTTFDLDSGNDKEDVQVTKTYTLKTTKDTKPGIYPISVKTTYDEDKIIGDAAKTVNLEVTDCEVMAAGTTGTTTGTTTTGATTTTVTAGTNVAQPPAKTTTSLDSNTKLIYLGYVVVIAVFLLVFMKLVGGKKGPKMDEDEF